MESSLHEILEASEEREMRLRQRGSEKPSRRDEDGAESILYGRLEASEER